MTKVEALIRKAQQAYRNEEWEEYPAFVQAVAWEMEINLEEAYTVVEDGPIVHDN